MLVALSSAAAPSASLAELVEGAARRGLSAVQLVAGHAHGISAASTAAELDAAVAIGQAAGVKIVGFEMGAVLDASRGNVDVAAARLFAEQPQIQHITLRGGGPEAAQFAGRGIGQLMARLALMNYQGVLTLAPSSKAVLPVWHTWLDHGRSWGCGSKTSDPSLFQLK
jgi:hypothetical protein